MQFQASPPSFSPPPTPFPPFSLSLPLSPPLHNNTIISKGIKLLHFTKHLVQWKYPTSTVHCTETRHHHVTLLVYGQTFHSHKQILPSLHYSAKTAIITMPSRFPCCRVLFNVVHNIPPPPSLFYPPLISLSFVSFKPSPLIVHPLCTGHQMYTDNVTYSIIVHETH